MCWCRQSIVVLVPDFLVVVLLAPVAVSRRQRVGKSSLERLVSGRPLAMKFDFQGPKVLEILIGN